VTAIPPQISCHSGITAHRPDAIDSRNIAGRPDLTTSGDGSPIRRFVSNLRYFEAKLPKVKVSDS